MDIASPVAEIGHRIVKLPPLGAQLPHLGGSLGAIMRGKPEANGIGQFDYALIVPHGPQFEQACAWGGYGHDAPICADTWDGFNNTAWLLADKQQHPAALFCADIEHAGFKDFYLPSLRELKALYAAGCEAYDPEAAYWSSTQCGRSDAFSQYFGNGDTHYDGKDWEGCRARPVRRSSLESLIA